MSTNRIKLELFYYATLGRIVMWIENLELMLHGELRGIMP